MRKIIVILFFAVAGFTSANAQIDLLKDTSDHIHDYCKVCHDHKHVIIKPPYSTTFKKELPFIVTSAVVFGAGFLSASDKTEPFTKEELENNPPKMSSINFIDRSSADNWSPQIANASDYVLFSTALLPALFLSEHHTSTDITKLAIMYIEVFTINYGLTEIAKNTVARKRPYVYNPEVPIGSRVGGDSKKSFFSGHTSQTAAACFYFAKVIDDYHPTLQKNIKRGIWAFAIAVPAVNGYLRVKAGKHFPTDVISGYIIGAATGLLVPQLHRTKRSKDLTEKLDVGFMPGINGGMQMSFRYTY